MGSHALSRGSICQLVYRTFHIPCPSLPAHALGFLPKAPLSKYSQCLTSGPQTKGHRLVVVCELSGALHWHMELLRQTGRWQPTLLPNLEPPPGSQSLLQTGKQDSLFQLDPRPPSLEHHRKLGEQRPEQGLVHRGKSFTAPFPPYCTEVGTPRTGPVGGEPRGREL